jgi:23S rRNA pseudouridine1911/1915/1917 synthase
MQATVEEEGVLLAFLEKLYPDSSRTTIRKWLEVGKVTVDGKTIVRANHPLRQGQLVAVGKVTTTSINNIPILYEDPYLVIVDKPEGLLSVPLDTPGAKNVLNILRNHYKNSVYAVHRIDQETSGSLLFAKTEEALLKMKDLFATHDLTREYLAVVEGQLPSNEGTWVCHLYERSPSEVAVTTRPGEGKEAITHYKVIKKLPKSTFLLLTLETGRKHQIRVHCKEAGNPIVGDARYGAQTNPYNRLALHAHRLAFTHPITGKKVDVTAKPNKIFK